MAAASANTAAPAVTTVRWAAMALSATLVLGYPVWNALPVDPMSLVQDRWQLLWLPLLLCLLALPFACAGLFVSRVFAAWSARAPWLYGADLGGAALGVLAYVALMPSVGGPGTLIVAGALAGLAALLLHPGALAGRVALALWVALLLGSANEVEPLLPLRIRILMPPDGTCSEEAPARRTTPRTE